MSAGMTYTVTQFAFKKLLNGETLEIGVGVNLQLSEELRSAQAVPMILWCPGCSARHIDRGEFATKPHHTHACQECGMVWRPAIVPTVGVQFLPGFKDGEK